MRLRKRVPMLIVVASLIVTGCAGPSTNATTTSPPEPSEIITSAVPVTALEALESYAATLETRPKSTETQVREIGLKLAEIQPEMAELKVTRIESWSDSMCGDIWTQRTTNLAATAVQRFAGGDRPPLTEAQGQQIVDEITEVYCHP